MKKLLIACLAIATLFMSCDQVADTNNGADSEELATPNEENSADMQAEETMKVAMAFMGAMGEGDMEKMTSLMDEDMVWHNEGDKALPWIGPWRGKTVILEQFLPLFGENLKTLKWETEDAMSSGDTAAFFGRMVALATKSNKETKEFTFALRVKVKDGKIVLWNWLEDSYDVSQAYHGGE